MTPQAQKDMAELGLDEQALAAKQEHISQLLNGSDKLGEQPAWMAKAKAETIALDTPEQAEFRKSMLHEQLKASVALMDGPKKKHRQSPVKGVCVHCGKNYSRHCQVNGEALCFRLEDSRTFSLEQKAPAIAQQPGFLSAEQASRLRDLIGSRESRRVELDATAELLGQHQTAFNHACLELNAFIDELQGKGK